MLGAMGSLEVRDPPARKASRRAVVYGSYTRDAITRFTEI
jgi:hypothetical protein